MLDREAAHGESVHQRMVRSAGQGVQGARHGEVGRAENVETVDFLDAGLGHGPEDPGLRGECRVESRTFFRRDLFRVVEAVEFEAVRQDDRSGYHGPGERAASGFVHARDQKKTASAQGTLAGEIAGHGAAFA